MDTKKKGRGKPQTTWLTNVHKDIKELGIKEEDIYHRNTWRRKIRKADPE